MLIFQEISFEAAHKLPRVMPGHKCGRLHGHSFKARMLVRGEQGVETGWVMDFADIKDIARREVVDRLDHCLLNEVPGLENPTSENIARWIWGRVKSRIPGLVEVMVQENCTTGAIFRGDAE